MDIGLFDGVWDTVQLCWKDDALQRPAAKKVLEVLEEAAPSWRTGSTRTSTVGSDVESLLEVDSTLESENILHGSDTSVIHSRDITPRTSIVGEHESSGSFKEPRAGPSLVVPDKTY